MKHNSLAALLVCGALSLSLLAGCGSAGNTGSSQSQASDMAAGSSQAPAASSQTSGSAAPSGGKVLVAYFSASGNTRQVAEKIAGAAGGDLFEITPADAYTSDDLDWTESGSRVNREHENEALRDIALTQTTPANWDEYDTVLIGYPIWWGIAAWPVNGFVTGNDFTGKTVIPFATSASSGMGQSGTLLAQLAGTGDWQEGQRFSGGASASEVTAWANSLGLGNDR